MRVLHHNVYRTPLGRANALHTQLLRLGDLVESLTGPAGARGKRMIALPHWTTTFDASALRSTTHF